MSAERLSWEQAVEWLRSQPDKTDLVRHCYFDDPVESAAQRFHASEEWRAIRRLIADRFPADVLDIGAGRGISSYAFARDRCRVVALEPNDSDLVGTGAIARVAEKTGTRIDINTDVGESLSFEDGRFGIVYGRAVLHHARDLPQFCREAARVLKPGGVFLATREHVVSSSAELVEFFAQHPLHFLYGGENAYRLDQYLEAIKGAGLKVRKVIGPFDSVINFAPISEVEFEADAADWLARRVGRRAAFALAGMRACRALYGAYRSARCRTAGRHYSFLATK